MVLSLHQKACHHPGCAIQALAPFFLGVASYGTGIVQCRAECRANTCTKALILQEKSTVIYTAQSGIVQCRPECFLAGAAAGDDVAFSMEIQSSALSCLPVVLVGCYLLGKLHCNFYALSQSV